MTDMLDMTHEAMPIGGIRPAPGVSAPADLVVRNAKIHSGDKMRPAASAVAIRDGRFQVVGGDADVAPLIGPATRVVDAVGRRVVPGLNDSHQHAVLAAGPGRGPAQRPGRAQSPPRLLVRCSISGASRW